MSEVCRCAAVDDENEIIQESPLGRLRILEVYNTADPRKARTAGSFNMLKLSAMDGSVYIAFLAEHDLIDDRNSSLGRRQVRFERWTYLQVSPERLDRLESGVDELNRAFLSPEKDCLWNVVKEDSSLTEIWRGAVRRFDFLEDIPSHPTYLQKDAFGNIHVAGIDEQAARVCRELRQTVGEISNMYRAEASHSYDDIY